MSGSSRFFVSSSIRSSGVMIAPARALAQPHSPGIGNRDAVDNGARVICSTQRMRGGAPPCFMVWNDEGEEALQYARDHGVLFVQGVGNKGCDIDTLEGENVYNAGFDNFIGVASATNADDLSAETNFGKTLVPVAAPSFQMTTIDIVEPYKIKGGQGTSYSTPIVSGVCALVWAAHPGWNHHQVRDAVFRSAEYKQSLFPWVSHGRVNAAYAVSVREGVDSDGDGVTDAGDDNCPFRANPFQEDADGDGTGDACDPEIDGDGFPYPVDCDDFNPRIHPYAADPCDGLDTDCDGSDGVPEVPDNGVDDDCDGKVDEGCFLRLVTF